MRITLRLKLAAIVAIAAITLIALTVSSGLSEQRVEAQVDSIRETYLPKIRLRPVLQAGFEHLARTVQSSVEAADADLLTPAAAERDALQHAIAAAGDALSAGQSTALRLALSDYYDAALSVSRRLIAGEGGETTAAQVQDMQGKRSRVMNLIDQTTAFDENALASAFAATKTEQHRAMMVRIVAGAICLIALLGLSVWIGRALLGNVGALIEGFERFGRNDFSVPIAPTGRDELADVARRANRMAEQLEVLDHERARSAWVRTGLAGLGDELLGDLDPGAVADRTIAFLARYLQAPVGAFYACGDDGSLALLGSHGVAAGTVPETVRAGDGVLAQAATRTALSIIETPTDALRLRSGLVDVQPHALVMLPLARGERITGVLELATVRTWRDADSELLTSASETIAIALEVARARASTRTLLERTREQAREIEKASAYKSQFLATMSHELRTPLNAIIGFSEIMYDASIPLDDETRREYLGDILTSGRHLLQLINDVLDLAKVEAGKVEFHPEPLSLSRVVGEVLAVLRTTSAKQQVEVATEISSEVDALVLDPSRLKQVLYNYLSNALKFTPPRGRVVVRATPADDERVRIEVEDSGIGIAPAQLGRLFGDYQQTEDGARKSGSTGLGLALTKRLVEAQGGEVGVRSTPGQGSTFHVTLPRLMASTSRTPSRPRVISAGQGGRTILVVEDEAADREQLVRALASAGYAVEAVSTGAEAIERCASRTYDAITLDLLLPDMTGLEVLQAVRQGRNGDVPVIVVTVVAERGAVAGFAVHDVLAKPLAESALLSSLQRAGVAAAGGSTVVLVVDDDPASLRVMSATLGRLGYLAVCEPDPVRGLRIATEEPPSAIVLDLLMPGMTGFEFLERFRSTPIAREVPVIVWTSKDLTAEELARLRLSANAVVSKGNDGNARVLEELATSLPKRSLRSAS